MRASSWFLGSFAASFLSLTALFPQLAQGSDTRPARSHILAPSPERQAITGGIVTLRTPGSSVILIPRGTFPMGSKLIEVQLALEACKREPLGGECKDETFSNELDGHPVSLSPFWMDRTEVSVRAYKRCVGAGRCDAIAYDQGGTRYDRENYPVSLVSWDQATKYCSFMGQRLPTEAEWERAARGLSGRRFPWGEHYASRRANHGSFALDNTDKSDGFAELAPVGSYPDGRTREGFDDLAGNVAEWTADNYEDAYEAIPVTDPKGPRFGAHKVVRGGAFVFAMPWLRGAARLPFPSATRKPHIGFRCASDAFPHYP